MYPIKVRTGKNSQFYSCEIRKFEKCADSKKNKTF